MTDEEKKLHQFIRMEGDCCHPWYVIPDELDKDTKDSPVKCPFCRGETVPVEGKISGDKLESFIRLVGDCGHPWYIVPHELDEELKGLPMKCPFCECDGDPVYALVEEMRESRSDARHAVFKDRRRRR